MLSSKLAPDTSNTMRDVRTAHAGVAQSLIIGLTAFLTVVDLFAAQALLPTLTKHYNVAPSQMGLAVNACTFGMAFAGLFVAMFGANWDRRQGILIALLLLSIPTTLLAFAPNLLVFAGLRIVQGLLMATAFSLTLGYLGEHYSATDTATAFAAYITGNVASNLVGRFIAATVSEHAGLAANFYVFAALNIAGAVLVYATVERVPRMLEDAPPVRMSPFASIQDHLAKPQLRAAFGIGFFILFAFIGTFTYVNFVLTRSPLSVGMMQLGFIYLVFLPSVLTTPFAGRAVARFGTRETVQGALGIAAVGLPMLVTGQLPWVLTGMVLVAVGTFFAQAAATGFVSRAATSNRGAASGLYLASYFLGGLTGSAVLGQIFDRDGWTACVFGIASSLLMAGLLAAQLRKTQVSTATMQ